MDNLVIDREQGVYRFTERGKEYQFPTVTTVLDSIFPFEWGTEWALERGRKVHRATALLDGWGDGSGLDWSTVHPSLLPYVEAYAKFRAEAKMTPVVIEVPMRSMKYRYACTPDRIVRFKRGRKEVWAILDIKTGSLDPKTALQLAAGLQAFKETTLDMGLPTSGLERLALVLRNDGTAKPTWFEDQGDLGVFLSLLNAHQWGVKNYGNSRTRKG